MPVIVGVALGGALGASARWLLDRFIEQHTESVFPWSTFAINVTGCFVIGVVIETLVDRHHLPAWIRDRHRRRRARRLHDVLDVRAGDASRSSSRTTSASRSRYATASVVIGVLAVYAGTALGRAF